MEYKKQGESWGECGGGWKEKGKRGEWRNGGQTGLGGERLGREREGEKSKTLRKERNRCGTGKEEVGECYGGKFWKRD